MRNALKSPQRFATGELPDWAGVRFNNAKWKRENKETARGELSHHTQDGYRERRAKILLARIQSGELAPAAVAGIEQDYKVELAKLRGGAK